MVLFVGHITCAARSEDPATPDKKIIVGYVPGFRGVLDQLSIDARKLTHINYAFVNVRDSMAWLTNIETDTINFRILNQLKEVNPDLKILISIGGWSWSGHFSDAVLTPQSRTKFATTSVQIVSDYDLDGVDIDWEYPGQRGNNNVFRPEDRQNYTLMFAALRDELDKLSELTGKEYELTTAVGANSSYIEHTEMDQAVAYLDYVNLMTYDFYTSGDSAGHHSNLYPPEDDAGDASAHKSVRLFLEAGVPAEKLVLGVPFYGRSWIMKSAEKHGINMPVAGRARGGGYTYIRDSLVNKNGFVRYWDEKAMAPYLFNTENNQLVTYDDEESVKLKCEYVIDNNLAGIMFWQYASDPGEYLLDAINEHLYPKGSGDRSAHRITTEGTTFQVNGREIFMNGVNTPWDNWNDFGGDYNHQFWDTEFRKIRQAGGNASRIWITCNGDVGINISPDGVVSGATLSHWEDLDDMFALAARHKVYIMATLISFDHTKNTNKKFQSWRNMFADTANVGSYINHYVYPFLQRYKDNPYLWCIDICNEPEWMHENAECGNIAWSRLQYFAARVATAVHENSDVLVTLGSAGTKWNGECPNCEGNFWSDKNLQSQYKSPQAFLDFYSPHFYGWNVRYFGNFALDRSPVDYGINDRPCMVGENPAGGVFRQDSTGRNILEVPINEAFIRTFENGWKGLLVWTSNGVDRNGTLTECGPGLTAFQQKYPDLVSPIQ